MDLISGNSVVDVCGSFVSSNAHNHEKCTAREDVVATYETITSTNNPAEVVLERAAVVQKKLVVKEKIVVPKELLSHNYLSADVNPSVDVSYTNADSCEEMEFSSQTSQWSKMELGSQEDQLMVISSQDSMSSIMDASSQDLMDVVNHESTVSTFQPHDPDGIGLKNCDHQLRENNSKRKFTNVETEEFIFNKLPQVREESLTLREKVVAMREAAVNSREMLLKNVQKSIKNCSKHATSKRRRNL